VKTPGAMLAAAVAALIRDSVIYVVRPSGEIVETDPGTKYGTGQRFLTRVAAEAAAKRIVGRN
jgi:hypothetical protein